jgi:hypothetical protein
MNSDLDNSNNTENVHGTNREDENKNSNFTELDVINK